MATCKAMRKWAIVGGLLLTVAAHGKPTLVTLPELVKKSQLIAYGHVVEIEPSPSRPSHWLQLRMLQVLKGVASVKNRSVLLCNERPRMGEWPDLTMMTGDRIFFLTLKDSGCFELAHSDRAIVLIRDSVAYTVAIKDQPEDQPAEAFVEKVRRLVRQRAH